MPKPEKKPASTLDIIKALLLLALSAMTGGSIATASGRSACRRETVCA
jgi:hypothetical protein